jgi:hypothetical protein
MNSLIISVPTTLNQFKKSITLDGFNVPFSIAPVLGSLVIFRNKKFASPVLIAATAESLK